MILIGTLPFDIEGTKRLEHILEVLQPKRITVQWPSSQSVDEIKSDILDERGFMMDTIASWGMEGKFYGVDIFPGIEKLYLDIVGQRYFEVAVPLEYAKRRGIEVFPVDHPDFRREHVADFMDGVRKEILSFSVRTLLRPYEDLRTTRMSRFDGLYTSPSLFQQWRAQLGERQQSISPEEREQYMTKEISRRNPGVHIGGMVHVFQGFSDVLGVIPLYQRLGQERVHLKMSLYEATDLT